MGWPVLYFEIIYTTNFHGVEQFGGTKYDSTSRRCIAADDFKMAERISKAMIGESVNSGEYITWIISVKETKDPAVNEYWCDKFTWVRVLKQMRILSIEVPNWFWWNRQKRESCVEAIKKAGFGYSFVYDGKSIIGLTKNPV